MPYESPRSGHDALRPLIGLRYSDGTLGVFHETMRDATVAETEAIRAQIIEGFAVAEDLLGDAQTYSNRVDAGPLTAEALLRAYHEMMHAAADPRPMTWPPETVWDAAVGIGLVDAHLAPPAVEHTEALVDLARSNRETDFRDLAAAVGVPLGDIDELWRGTRSRLGVGS